MLIAMTDDGGWAGLDWQGWTDLDQVRARLDAGADPNAVLRWPGPPLHAAAEHGSAEVVAELARRVDDVDALTDGRTALWRAVAANRPDNAAALVAAGADPWRDMMSGWSPGRLSLAGLTPELFGSDESLSPEETAVVAESRRLIAAIVEEDRDRVMDAWMDDPNDEGVILTMWATDVLGGCVLAQPWGYGPQMPGVTKALSTGTTCYGMYANPKSGNQGSILRDGEVIGWDLHPGGDPGEDGDMLLSYLYQHNALAYCFAHVGLRPTDNRAVVGPPDVWIRLPEGDYWR
jgi:hypothetical protein